MKRIWIVTASPENEFSRFETAFETFEEAGKFRDYLDQDKGASSESGTIHDIFLYDDCNEVPGVFESE